MPRYQSNLFNFFSRQSTKLRDRSDQTWRQMKLAAVWGLQILLYPIYVGFQTARLATKQLRHTARQVLPKLGAVVQTVQPVKQQEFLLADTPIQRSLQLIEQLNLALPADRVARQLDPADPAAPGVLVVLGGSATAQSMLPAASELLTQGQLHLQVAGAIALPAAVQPMKRSIQPVQGLASLLSSRRLVLVTTENQLLDVLSAEQAALLQRRVVGEVANYWRQQRRSQLEESRLLVDSFLPLPAARPNALPPLRAIWQVMTWMQTSSVAIATNLFQEADLQPIAPSDGLRLPAAAMPLRSAQPSWKTKDEWLSGITTWLRSGVAEFSHRLQPVDPQAPPPLPPQQPSQPSQQNWLDWHSLFGKQPLGFVESLIQRRSPNLEQSTSALVPAPDVASWELQDPTFLDATQAEIAKRAQPQQAGRSLLFRQPPTETLVPAAETAPLAKGQSPTDLVNGVQPSASELVTNSAWIEAEVRLVTYEKHPLEQLLDWLDRGMSWVEIKVSRVWRWLRDRWSA